MVESGVPNDTWLRAKRVLLFVVGAVLVLILLRYVGGAVVGPLGARPDIPGETALYLTYQPVLATSTLPATSTVGYGIHNATREPHLYDISGRLVTNDSDVVVFERQEYLAQNERRTWDDVYLMEHATGTLIISERSTGRTLVYRLAPFE